MIGGKKKKNLKEEIYKRINDYDIYKMFYPGNFTLNRKCSSPRRRDSDPSFVIKYKEGNYYHIDYGDGNFRGNAIDFVMQMEGVDFPTALRLIDTKFGLGIESELKDWKSTISKYEQPKIVEIPQHIETHHKAFSKSDHEWWNSYHLSEDYLKSKNVFRVKTLWISRQRVPLDPLEPVYVYIAEDGKRKIYRPTIPRNVKKEERQRKWRFKGNIPFTYMFGKENIINCKKSLCLKSRKDELVCSLILPCVFSVQGENIACFSDENVSYINKNSQETYLGFGSDEQGVRESKLITSTFGWKHFNTPREYLPLNDPAEIAKRYGLKELENLLKLKKVI